MRVKLSYIDRDSISPQEIALNAKRIHGDDVEVQLLPEGKTARDHIRHAINLEITSKQLHSFFDDEQLIYEEKVETLKREFIQEVRDLLDETVDNNKATWTM